MKIRRSAGLLWVCFCLLMTGCNSRGNNELNLNNSIDSADEQTNLNNGIDSADEQTNLNNSMDSIDDEQTENKTVETEENSSGGNTQGNHNGNLLNDGIAAFDDDNIYYVNDNQTKLYKRVRTTQDEKLLLEDEKITQLNVNDNYIFYLDSDGNIIRLDLDGNNKELIFENKSISFQRTCIVSNGSIYYAQCDEFQKGISSLTSMKLDGTQEQVLSEQCNGYASKYDDWLYYGSSEDGSIWKIRSDGEENQKIIDGRITHFLVEDDTIYYVKVFNDVVKCDLNGKNASYIYRGEVSGLNIYNKNIIILDGSYIPTMIEGETTKVLSNTEMLRICIVDNEIFYLDVEFKMDKPILIQ